MISKGFVKFNGDRCKGCELCVWACPKKLIKISGAAVNALGYHTAAIDDMDKCTACANCALMCPDGAISVYKETGEGK